MDTTSDVAPDAELYTALHPTPAAEHGPRTSRREQAYRTIRAMVLAGEFPFSVRLAEETIAEQLGVSRTPVREAFARLDADGILRRYDDGGYHVAEPNLLDLRDLYELRLTLELRGILRAQTDGVSHDEAALRALLTTWQEIRRGPLPAADGSFITLDESFHVGLSRASGNLVMTETLESVNLRIRPVRVHDFFDAERIDTSIDEHLEIVQSVLDGAIETAADQLRRHIGVSLDVAEERAVRAITRMIRERGRRR